MPPPFWTRNAHLCYCGDVGGVRDGGVRVDVTAGVGWRRLSVARMLGVWGEGHAAQGLHRAGSRSRPAVAWAHGMCVLAPQCRRCLQLRQHRTIVVCTTADTLSAQLRELRCGPTGSRIDAVIFCEDPALIAGPPRKRREQYRQRGKQVGHAIPVVEVPPACLGALEAAAALGKSLRVSLPDPISRL